MATVVNPESDEDRGQTEVLFPEARQRARRRHLWTAGSVLLAAAVVAGITVAATSGGGSGHRVLGGPGHSSSSPAVGGHGTGHANTPSSASAVTPKGDTSTAVAVAVVTCPTDEGVPTTSTTIAPATVDVAGVTSSLVGQIDVYTDSLGILRVVAPAGWTCASLVGADGSSDLVVVPPGQSAAQPQPLTPSSEEAVAANETSTCFLCTLGQACPLFPAAVSAFQSATGRGCTRPGAEQVVTISPTVVGFEDPAGVAGDGSPSGGPYPANGVVTYNPPGPDGSFDSIGSYAMTCTLPAAQHALCTVALNDFVSRYATS